MDKEDVVYIYNGMLLSPRRVIPLDHVTQVPLPSGFLLGPANGRHLLIEGKRSPPC